MPLPFWDQTGDADGSGRGNYFQGDGEYDVEIQAVKHRQGYRGESVIVNMVVLSSTRDDVPIGAAKSSAFNITKQPVLAIGLDAGRKDADTKTKVNFISKRMVEADNPLRGARVHLTTFETTTQRGQPFTNLDWAPYKAEPGYVPPMPGASGHVATATPPPPPPPAPPPAVDPRAGWRRENGHRLNPHTNSWELDAK